MTDQENRVKHAIENLFDTGNALPDSFDELLMVEDGAEIELALMGIAPKVDGVTKDWDYYTNKLREIFVGEVEAYLDYVESEYGTGG